MCFAGSPLQTSSGGSGQDACAERRRRQQERNNSAQRDHESFEHFFLPLVFPPEPVPVTEKSLDRVIAYALDDDRRPVANANTLTGRPKARSASTTLRLPADAAIRSSASARTDVMAATVGWPGFDPTGRVRLALLNSVPLMS